MDTRVKKSLLSKLLVVLEAIYMVFLGLPDNMGRVSRDDRCADVSGTRFFRCLVLILRVGKSTSYGGLNHYGRARVSGCVLKQK